MKIQASRKNYSKIGVQLQLNQAKRRQRAHCVQSGEYSLENKIQPRSERRIAAKRFSNDELKRGGAMDFAVLEEFWSSSGPCSRVHVTVRARHARPGSIPALRELANALAAELNVLRPFARAVRVLVIAVLAVVVGPLSLRTPSVAGSRVLGPGPGISFAFLKRGGRYAVLPSRRHGTVCR